ncbi:hypothetical protein Cpin_3171 [Chitinophaga pinensis DSM 2588]|uniref:Uncharacterized protein n=1 Tax=Chitinophaga pinensis (strain ATCC 43595 / DSM 2588 / LMG 13176 / NBRC 15968 / NCIMB 11800 / UQM 2034) TaxID=485918 RepID=A0A979G4N8_CHIPD|nr:hypothetical protein Cpin_3171 [Chitinophaga pinensis DSM 2588]
MHIRHTGVWAMYKSELDVLQFYDVKSFILIFKITSYVLTL